VTADARAVMLYALGSAIFVVVDALLLSLAFDGEGARRALLVAAVVALVVQVAAFVPARRAAPKHRIAAWGAGAGLSLLTLIVFGFVARGTGLPLEPALFGLATFLFSTELLEPFFLR
jgi:hypothetical protein